ncbi:response regulator [Algivirga pacifica]|uniref:Response regulatory domain-containing protein n=1 Tax=Algivirga pacifica TaxID=1162670 RepID=A0ABP9DIH3_9BACT
MNSVLLAEAKSIDAAYMDLMLKRSGWLVDLIRDEASLEEKLHSNPYKVVILDDDTLGEDLTEAVKAIRQFEQANNQTITIIGTTSYSLRGQKKKLLGCGIDHCLSKPIYKNDLNSILETVVEELVTVQ